MRGAVSGGMALGLDELGLAQAFDAAYGSSAGTLNAMWLVSGRVRDGIPTWTDASLVGELISRRRGLLRRGPVVDVRRLVEERYEQLSPGLFDAVLAGSTELHPIATEVASAEAVDLHGDDPTIARCGSRCAPRPRCRCWRARRSRSAAGATSTRGCRRRSRSAPRSPTAPPTCSCCARGGRASGHAAGRVSGTLTGRALRRVSPALETAFRTRVEREARRRGAPRAPRRRPLAASRTSSRSGRRRARRCRRGSSATWRRSAPDWKPAASPPTPRWASAVTLSGRGSEMIGAMRSRRATILAWGLCALTLSVAAVAAALVHRRRGHRLGRDPARGRAADGGRRAQPARRSVAGRLRGHRGVRRLAPPAQPGRLVRSPRSPRCSSSTSSGSRTTGTPRATTRGRPAPPPSSASGSPTSPGSRR